MCDQVQEKNREHANAKSVTLAESLGSLGLPQLWHMINQGTEWAQPPELFSKQTPRCLFPHHLDALTVRGTIVHGLPEHVLVFRRRVFGSKSLG